MSNVYYLIDNNIIKDFSISGNKEEGYKDNFGNNYEIEDIEITESGFNTNYVYIFLKKV